MITAQELISWLNERVDLAVKGVEHASEQGDREQMNYWMGQCTILEQVKMIVYKMERASKEASLESVHS